MDVNFNIGVDLTPLRQGLNEGVDLVEKAGQEVSNGQNGLAQPFKEATKEVSNLNKELVKTGTESNKSNAGLEAYTNSLKNIRQEIIKLEKENQVLITQYENQKTALAALKNTTPEVFNKMKAGIDSLKLSIDKNTASLKKMKIDERDARAQTNFFKTQSSSLGDNISKVTKLTTLLRQMKNELASGNLTREEFEKMSIDAARLQDQIGDISQRIRNLASDTFAIDALVSGVQSLAGAFAFGQGVVALFGDENEEMQKTLLKVNAAMAALQGLQQIQQTLLEESAAKTFIVTTAQKLWGATIAFVNNGIKINNVQTAINTTETTANAIAAEGAAIAETELAVATTGATFAMKAFRVALLATGIGAIIVGLGLLVENWDKLTEAILGSNEALEEFNKLNATTDEAIKLTDEATDIRIRKLQLENAETKKIVDAKIEGNKQVISLAQEELDAAKQVEAQGFKNVKQLQENAKRQTDLIAVIEERQLQNKEFTKEYYKDLSDAFKNELEQEKADEDEANKERLENRRKLRQDALDSIILGINDRIAGIELELLTVEKGTIREIELYNQFYDEKKKLIEQDATLTVNQSKLALALIEKERQEKIKALQQINLVNIQGNNAQLSTIEDFFAQEQALNEQRFLTGLIREKEYQKNKLQITIDSLEEQKTKLTEGTAAFIELENEILKVRGELADLSTNSLGSVMADLFGVSEDELKQIVSGVQNTINAVLDVVEQGLNDQIALNAQYISDLDNRIEATENALDQELQLNEQGFASNVQAKKDELKLLQEAREDALADQRAALRTQQTLDTISQTLSLVTSAANIFESLSGLGPIGIALGAVAVAALIAAFVASKAQAANAVNSQQFFKGGEYGYTGDGSPYEESRRLGVKPYTYHKKEFIFNHKKTEENIELFRSIHGDNTVGIIKGVEKLLEGTGVTLAPDLPGKTEKTVIRVKDLVESNNYEAFSDIFGHSFEELHDTVTHIKKYLDDKIDYIPIEDGRLEAKRGNIIRKVKYKK